MLSLPLDTWSESFWTMIETMIVRFEPTNRVWVSDVKNYFLSLPRLLPCQQCATHLIRFNYDHPLMSHLDSQLKFFIWVFQLRKSMGFKYSEREYLQYMYTKFRMDAEKALEALDANGGRLTKDFVSNAMPSRTIVRKPCNCNAKKPI